MPYLPTPSPWTLRLTKGSPLTHAELDNDLKILNQKINDTQGENIGLGAELYVDKVANANDGFLRFRTISGDILGSGFINIPALEIIIITLAAHA